MIKAAANALAEAIQNSEEFKEYKTLDKAIEALPELKEKLESFQARQFALQRAHLTGAAMDENELKAMDSLFGELVQNETIARYFEAELKINQVMTEVSRILGDAMNFRNNTAEQA